MGPETPKKLSLVKGPTQPPLRRLTFGQLLDKQAKQHGGKAAIVVPWTGARLSYEDLRQRAQAVARGLVALGVSRGAHVGILCGDDERFIELFFACGRIGAVLVILNKTYTAFECERALRLTEPSVLFIADRVNHKDTGKIVQHLQEPSRASAVGLKTLISIRNSSDSATNLNQPGSVALLSWEAFLDKGNSTSASSLAGRESQVDCQDIVNLQFTSGTTGDPKAVMLSHFNLVNNATFIGNCMDLVPEDIICCPPPLFHCFGLVAGLLAALTHGSAIIYPSRDFDPDAVAEAVINERCTVLHGVATMFSAVMTSLERKGLKPDSIRTGIAAGNKIPPVLLTQLREKLGFADTAICYGMTETSPSSFMTVPSDSFERKLETVGRVLPHTMAKIVDKNGRILPCGMRGEIAVAGYLVQRGYYKNPAKTAEALIPDENGTVWMHTGDEGFLDQEGYCTITGRIKDIIIRGGENIYPLEIEERLLEHSSISQAAIVGVKDAKYGEVIAAFLQLQSRTDKPSLDEIRAWVRQVLAPQKAPSYVFWVGPDEAVPEYPVTGSGKFRKDLLRSIGDQLKEKENMAPVTPRDQKL